MNVWSNLWKKLTRSKQYREAFVASQLKRGIPTQIRILRKQRGWTQADLAEASGLTQGAISRAEDPDYGNLTFNNILKIAAGFDIAFVGRFVPFSELARWKSDLSEETLRVSSFEDEFFADDVGDEDIRDFILGWASSAFYIPYAEIKAFSEDNRHVFSAEARNNSLAFHQEAFDFYVKESIPPNQIDKPISDSTEVDEGIDLAA